MEVENILNSVSDQIKSFYYQSNLRHVDDSEVVDYATPLGTRTQHGSLVFSSNIKDSSLSSTIYVGTSDVLQSDLNQDQKRIMGNLPFTLQKVRYYMSKVPFICFEKTMCNNDTFNPRCILFTSFYRKENIRLPFFFGQSLFSLPRKSEPTLNILCIPEWPVDDRQTIVFPEIGVTYILGNDSFQEIRNGFLRMAMWSAKQRGILPLSAGAKLVLVFDEEEKRMKSYGALFIGPSGTGKTTHTGDNLILKGKGEGIKPIQDDFVLLRQNAQILGIEKTFWVRTHMLDSALQPLIWRAVLNRKTLFENVIVDHQGRLDFQDSTLTTNGRALLQISDLLQGEENINSPPLDELDGMKIFLLTRINTVVPPICKLTPAQAAALFTLGESTISEGDREVVIRTPASNPLLVGSAEEEAEAFWNFLEQHKKKVQTYLVNTGSMGKPPSPELGSKRKYRPKTIEISELSTIVRAIFKGAIEWKKAQEWEALVPQKVENLSMDQYELENFYSSEENAQLIQELRDERKEYLQKFPNLPKPIKEAII